MCMVVAALFCLGCHSSGSAESLVPAEAGESPNAWCTWATQNLSLVPGSASGDGKILFAGDQGAASARENIGDCAVFSEGGWVDGWDAVRGDLTFLFDDGWDVKPNIDKAKEIYLFGSLELDESKFPSCADNSFAQRLKKLNARVRERGWKGAGLWVAAQCARKNPDEKFTPEREREYWRERILWSKEAGINYWKVDWGERGHSVEFRKMLTELGAELHPGLLIEHSIPSSPVNDLRFDKSKGAFVGSGAFENSDPKLLDRIRALLKVSGYTRVYDTITPLTTPSTISRTAWYLSEGEKAGGKGLINVEDDVYTGAGLGCAYGVMRSPFWGAAPSDEVARRRFKSAEVVRAVRWSRIAPAFPLDKSKTVFSEERLEDDWTFSEGQTWWRDAWGRKLVQSAPAVVARNLPLPKVSPEGADAPFVLASRHPHGPIAVSVMPRIKTGRGIFFPPAKIAVDADISGKKVGLFGKFSSISFKMPKKPSRILAQDLASDSSEDVSDECEWSDGTLTIPGSLSDRLCAKTRESDDESMPAIVLLAE